MSLWSIFSILQLYYFFTYTHSNYTICTRCIYVCWMSYLLLYSLTFFSNRPPFWHFLFCFHSNRASYPIFSIISHICFLSVISELDTLSILSKHMTECTSYNVSIVWLTFTSELSFHGPILRQQPYLYFTYISSLTCAWCVSNQHRSYGPIFEVYYCNLIGESRYDI